MAVRFHELSRLQKTLSIVLMDEHVHEKVCIKSEKGRLCDIRFSLLG